MGGTGVGGGGGAAGLFYANVIFASIPPLIRIQKRAETGWGAPHRIFLVQ
jgi:hypothetical protein